MRRQRAFTLIELLIALSIFAVLALLAYGGLNNLMVTRAATEVRAEELNRLQMTYRLLERDIEQWVPRPIRNEFGEREASLRAGDRIEAVLELTRGGWRNPAEQPRSALQRVAYAVRDKALLRYQWPTLDRAPDAEPREQTLLEDVDELRLRFLDAADQWQERWPPAGQAAGQPGAPGQPGAEIPPRAVEVVLISARWGELRWLFLLPA